MMTCEQVREWLPWYVSGSIELAEAEHVASHLATCDACRSEFVETAQLRLRLGEVAGTAPAPTASAWRELHRKLGLDETVRVDLGSALLGLRLGIAANDPRSPVRGDLRVCGNRVRVIGTRRQRSKGA